MTAFRAYAPTGLEKSADYTVTAAVPGIETELYCAHATVGNRFKDYSMSYEKMTFCSLDWDFSAPLVLRVKPAREWKEVVIRPVHAGIAYVVEGDTVVITLAAPGSSTWNLTEICTGTCSCTPVCRKKSRKGTMCAISAPVSMKQAS